MTQVMMVTLEIIRALAWGGQHKSAEQVVFRTEAAFAKAWAADGGAEAARPAVDFEKEMVIAVFAGEKRTGGYAVKVESVGLPSGEAGGKIVVRYRETGPKPGAMLMQALTYPAHAIVVKQTPGDVEFVRASPPQPAAAADPRARL